jgi:hypothetical protein
MEKYAKSIKLIQIPEDCWTDMQIELNSFKSLKTYGEIYKPAQIPANA